MPGPNVQKCSQPQPATLSGCNTVLSEQSASLSPPCKQPNAATHIQESLCRQFCLSDFFLVPSSCGLKEREKKGLLRQVSVALFAGSPHRVPFHSKQTANNTVAENNCILKTFDPVSYMVDVRLVSLRTAVLMSLNS